MTFFHMKILLRHSSIDCSHYDELVLHDTFGIITFRAKKEIDSNGLQIPLIFNDSRDARIAYKRILQARNDNLSNVSISELECHWLVETALKIEQYAQHLFDFDRPLNL